MGARRPGCVGFVSSFILSWRCIAGFTVCVFCSVALWVAPAMAEVFYPLDGQLAPSSGSFGFLDASSVAVNDFNGDSYVADAGSGVVDVFDSGRAKIASLNGTYLCQITGSSTPSASECNAPGSSATPAGGFNAPGGIAVDQSTGDVYVIDANNGVIDVFGAGGAYLRPISLASVPGGFSASNTRGIAVNDFNGHVYVADSGPVLVYEFDAAGDYLSTWSGSNTPAGSFGGGYLSVAANDSNGTLYVTETAHKVTDVFDSSGKYIEQFNASYNAPRGTAVDQASGRIYVSDNGPSVIDILHREVTVGPRIREDSGTKVASTSATLDAVINPTNTATSYYFQYGAS